MTFCCLIYRTISDTNQLYLHDFPIKLCFIHPNNSLNDVMQFDSNFQARFWPSQHQDDSIILGGLLAETGITISAGNVNIPVSDEDTVADLRKKYYDLLNLVVNTINQYYNPIVTSDESDNDEQLPNEY